MLKKHLCLSAILLCSTLIAGAQTGLPKFKKGENYESVRTKMMKAGWKPFQSPDADKCMDGDALPRSAGDVCVCGYRNGKLLICMEKRIEIFHDPNYWRRSGFFQFTRRKTMMIDKKAAKSEYRMSHRPMGVFQIRNTTNDRVFMDSSLNIPGKINRHRFQLNAGMHQSIVLQKDWKELGEAAFEFETLEDVLPRPDANYDYAADLETLEDLWLEKLMPYGDNGYNKRKLTRDERLSMIRANRKL